MEAPDTDPIGCPEIHRHHWPVLPEMRLRAHFEEAVGMTEASNPTDTVPLLARAPGKDSEPEPAPFQEVRLGVN